MPEIISRKDAKARGMKRYFTGKPCKRGHVAEYHVSSKTCSECNRIRVSGFYADNPERKKQIERSSGARYRAKHAEKNSEWCRVYREQYPERRQETVRRYNAANPEKRLAERHARIAREKGNGGKYTPADIELIAERQNNLCAMCGVSFESTQRQIDHIIPVSRGGPNWPFNLQLLCGSCNRRKGAKLPSELTA